MSLPVTQPFYENISNRHRNLNKLADQGKKIIGYFCTYTPVEIIYASGFLPVRIMGGIDRIEKADTLTPNFICPYARQAFEQGLGGTYKYLSGIVQGYSCDVTCGLTNIWEDNIRGDLYHLIPLPYINSPEARSFFRAVLSELIEKLEKAGGRFSEERLEDALNLYRSIRILVIELYTLRYNRQLPISASEFLHVILAGFITPPEEYLEMLKALKKTLVSMHAPQSDGIPVLVSGSLIEEPRILEVVEESGGTVVADDLCTGYRNFQPPDGKGDNPIDRLIDRIMNHFPCPSRSRVQDRIPLLLDLLKKSGARGILFIFQKFCTPHLADHPILIEEFRKMDIPSLMFEMEETGIMEGQLRTRVEGFFEMLR